MTIFKQQIVIPVHQRIEAHCGECGTRMECIQSDGAPEDHPLVHRCEQGHLIKLPLAYPRIEVRYVESGRHLTDPDAGKASSPGLP